MLTSSALLTGWLRARLGGAERGASVAEYALLVALIAAACILAITLLGSQTSDSSSAARSLGT